MKKKIKNEKEKENDNENEKENDNENENDNIIKQLNDSLDDIIDKSKSSEEQIESIRKVENLDEYRLWMIMAIKS